MRRRRTPDSPPRRGVPTLWVPALGALLASAALTAVVLAPGASGTTLVGHGTSEAPGAPTPASGAAHSVQDASVVAGSFSITGSVGGLFPGMKTALVLTVSNPQTVTITVTSITTTVRNASTQCKAANVKVTPFSGSLVIKPGKAGDATVHVKLAHSAPNACQGAVFPFAYSGLATAK
jgi:hypothetical protein